MPTTLTARIREDVKDAMRAHDKQRLAALRLITAAIKQREVDTRAELDDDAVITVLDRMVKQRRDSYAQYAAAGRRDLADQEQFEIDLIHAYLPQPLEQAALEALIDEALTRTAAASMKDMGKVMAMLKPKVQGRADMGAVSARVRARLSAAT